MKGSVLHPVARSPWFIDLTLRTPCPAAASLEPAVASHLSDPLWRWTHERLVWKPSGRRCLSCPGQRCPYPQARCWPTRRPRLAKKLIRSDRGNRLQPECLEEQRERCANRENKAELAGEQRACGSDRGDSPALPWARVQAKISPSKPCWRERPPQAQLTCSGRVKSAASRVCVRSADWPQISLTVAGQSAAQRLSDSNSHTEPISSGLRAHAERTETYIYLQHISVLLSKIMVVRSK